MRDGQIVGEVSREPSLAEAAAVADARPSASGRVASSRSLADAAAVPDMPSADG